MADWSQFRNEPLVAETANPPSENATQFASNDKWAQFRNETTKESTEIPGLFPNVKGMAQLGKAAWETIPGHKYLSGALSSVLPEVKEEPGFEVHKKAGEIIGAGTTIAALATPLGRAVNAVIGGATGFGAAAVTSGLTGGLYKVLDTAQKEGRMATEEEIRDEAALFIGLDGAVKLAGQIFKYARGQPAFGGPPKAPKLPKEKKLEAKTDLTPYEASKAATEALPKEPSKPGPFQEIRTTQPNRPESLRGRVTPGGRQFGIDIRTTPRHPNTEQSVLQAFPYEIHSARHGGELATNLIRTADETGFEAVNEAYRVSRAMNETIIATDPQLANRLRERINMVDNTLLPTNVQEGLRRDAEELLGNLVANEERMVLNNENLLVRQNVPTPQPVSNQQIIDTIQNIHHKMKFEYEHGEATNIYNLLISDLEQALARRAATSGEQGAIQANQHARETYRDWAEQFNTPTARRFRNLNKEDYESRFNFLKKPDNFRELEPILNQTQEGRELIGAVRTEIVEKELGKFMKNPRAATQRELERKLRELGEVLTDEQVDHIRAVFNRERATFNRRVREQPTLAKQEKQHEALTKKAAQDTGIEPEKFWKEMDTRTGIQKIRNDLKGKSVEYNAIRDVKGREIVYGGNTTPGTGKEMAARLRVSKNKDLMIELYDEETYKALLASAEELEGKQATREMIKYHAKKIGKNIAVKVVLGILF